MHSRLKQGFMRFFVVNVRCFSFFSLAKLGDENFQLPLVSLTVKELNNQKSPASPTTKSASQALFLANRDKYRRILKGVSFFFEVHKNPSANNKKLLMIMLIFVKLKSSRLE